MPPDQHNSTMAKAMGLIFLLFDVASAWKELLRDLVDWKKVLKQAGVVHDIKSQ